MESPEGAPTPEEHQRIINEFEATRNKSKRPTPEESQKSWERYHAHWMALEAEQQRREEELRRIPEERIPQLFQTDNYHGLTQTLIELHNQGWPGLEGTNQHYTPSELYEIADQIPQLAEAYEASHYTDEELDRMLASMGATRAMGFRDCVIRCIKMHWRYVTRHY